MNWAQLLRLRNESAAAASILANVYARHPSSEHIRWQAASAYASAGEDKNAIKILTDSKNIQSVNPAMNTLLLDLLVKNDELDQAIEHFRSLAQFSIPSPRVAAAILSRSSTYPTPLDNEQIAILLKQALDFKNVPGVKTGQDEFLYLAENINNLEQWSDSLSGRVLGSVAWKSHLPLQAMPCESKERQIDNSSRIAEQLGVPKNTLKEGNNLASNGSFSYFDSDTTTLNNWQYVLLSGSNKYAFNHRNTNRAAFVTGLDSLNTYRGCPTLRIDGLVMENFSQLDPAVASFQHGPIKFPPNTWYIVQFVYRTENMNNTNLQILLAENYGFSLPDTAGTWQTANIIAHTGVQGNIIMPTLRSFSLGSVWFADFAVHTLDGMGISKLTDEPLFFVSNDD